MKPVSHRSPSPGRVHAGAAATAAGGAAAAAGDVGDVSKPSPDVLPAGRPAAAAGGGPADAAAAAAVALQMLGADAAEDGQQYVLKSKRRTAEEHAALQVENRVWVCCASGAGLTVCSCM